MIGLCKKSVCCLRRYKVGRARVHYKVHTTLKTGKPVGHLRIIESSRTLQKMAPAPYSSDNGLSHKPQREMNIAQFRPLSDCGKDTEKN